MGKLKAARKSIEDLYDLLRPMGQTRTVGDEQPFKDAGGVRAYRADPDYKPQGAGDAYRYVAYDEAENPLSVLQFTTNGPRTNKATIQQVYTEPEYRRQGHAARLLEEARRDFSVKHSTDLTNDGREWAKAVKVAAPAAVGLGAASQDSEAVPIMKAGKRMIEAFHGSPHKFDKFSMENIGTGEGAQAYGHGLYFADAEDVARGYRDNLTEWNKGAQELVEEAGSVEEARKWAIGRIDDLKEQADLGDDMAARLIEENQRTLANLDGYAETGRWNDGSLYRVHIDADPDTLLDWGKPLSEQPAVVQELAMTMPLDELPAGGRLRGKLQKWRDGTANEMEMPMGHDLYNAITDFGNDSSANAALTSRLREAGIPGIKYLDGVSRNAGEGSYNYVMFDDALVDIQERGFADPTLLAGMGATSALASASMAFSQRREESKGQWEGLRSDLLDTLSKASNRALGAGEDVLEAFDQPLRLGLAHIDALITGLKGGNPAEAFQQTMAQDSDQTLTDFGGYVTDQTGSPALGTAAYVAPQVLSPF